MNESTRQANLTRALAAVSASERVLWQGHPDPACVTRNSHPRAAALTGLLPAIFFFLIYLVNLKSGATVSFAAMPASLKIGGGFFVLVAIFGYLSAKDTARLMCETAYVITNARLLVSNKSAHRYDVQSKDLATFDELSLQDLGDGCGSILLPPEPILGIRLPSSRRQGKRDHSPFSLVMIRNPSDVQKILTEAVRAAKGVSA